MARRAVGFGMPVVVWSRRFLQGAAPPANATVVQSPEEVAAQSDVVSVHLALNNETRRTIGDAVFSRMKPGSYFVNTARGELVDYAALAKAVKTRGIRVALDVFPEEPAESVAPFANSVVAELKGALVGSSVLQKRLQIDPNADITDQLRTIGFSDAQMKHTPRTILGVGAPEGALKHALLEGSALKLEDVRSRLIGAGIEIQGGSPEQFGTVIQAEIDKWGRIVKEAGIQPE